VQQRQAGKRGRTGNVLDRPHAEHVEVENGPLDRGCAQVNAKVTHSDEEKATAPLHRRSGVGSVPGE
jgi:hypothetical protein